MAKFTQATESNKARTTGVPAKRQTGDLAASRVARRLVSSPMTLYLWLSGPPATSQERERAELADARNALYRRILVV